MSANEEIRGTKAQDDAIESALLQQVLALYPAALTVAELTREMGAESDAERDAIERAARDLGRAGLLQAGNQLVTPTRAALRLDELLGG